MHIYILAIKEDFKTVISIYVPILCFQQAISLSNQINFIFSEIEIVIFGNHVVNIGTGKKI